MIVLLLMVRNEERVLTRCLESAASLADAICIVDTGSTDNTLNVAATWLQESKRPHVVRQVVWKDFGRSRTESFELCREFCVDLGWNLPETHALLMDADMCLVVHGPVALKGVSYSLQQCGSGVAYPNVRLIRMDYPWRCVGPTHEYWEGPHPVLLKDLSIDDRGDGGCKADKYERDERLLRQGLEEEPTNGRFLFYLAQTLLCQGRLREAIPVYEARVAVGGWIEEVWYSTYKLAACHEALGDLVEMERWGLKGWQLDPRRVENLALLTTAFRERSQHFKAWHYCCLGAAVPMPENALFVESDVYIRRFGYERSILHYYVNEDRCAGARALVEHYNLHNDGTYTNLMWYAQPAKLVEVRPMRFPLVEGFNAGSTSFVRVQGGYLLNVRYSNYTIYPDGGYDCKMPVVTRNYCMRAGSDFEPGWGGMTEMHAPSPRRANWHIQGLEDVRLFMVGEGVAYIAASLDHASEGNVRQVTGNYGADRMTVQPLASPFGVVCEKNWIPLDADVCIYSWYPYRLYSMRSGDIVLSHETPHVFRDVRGSTTACEYQGSLYCIAHMVVQEAPRKYHHIVVKLNMQSKRVEGYTLPFYFMCDAIEYVLSVDIYEGVLTTIVSRSDADPTLCRLKFDELEFAGF
jgi:glycosyltransferase involved in cell wall biosynthesis